MFKDLFLILEAKDFLWLAGVVSAAAATLVQKLSSKYKPWNWLARQIGKAINAEVLEKQTALEKKVDNLEKRDDEQDAKQEKEKALAARRRILRCSDEIRRGDRHSEEYFNDVLDDITFYKRYCIEHTEFQNEKAVLAIEVVEKAYRHCLDKDDFL